MDMARTAVNVIGNCLATVVVAIWEKEYVRPGKLIVQAEPALSNPENNEHQKDSGNSY
jgi:Na+/H+-dicarboxylate symporter